MMMETMVVVRAEEAEGRAIGASGELATLALTRKTDKNTLNSNRGP